MMMMMFLYRLESERIWDDYINFSKNLAWILVGHGNHLVYYFISKSRRHTPMEVKKQRRKGTQTFTCIYFLDIMQILEIFPNRLNKPVSLRTKKLFEKPKQEEHPEIAVECPPPQGYGRSKLTSQHKKANHQMIHKVASLSINSDSSQESQNLWN